MTGFFNMDHKFFAAMSRAADLILLNLIFLVCCIPLVTIGASVTALYYVTLKMTRNEESYLIRSFLKSFRQNFRQSTLIWIILLLAAFLLGTDFAIIDIFSDTPIRMLRYPLMVIVFFLAMILLYVFPLQAKFENTIAQTFKNALLMSLRHLPVTLVMLCICAVPMALTLSHPAAFAYGIFLWVMIGFSLIAFVNSRFFVKIFDQYIPQEKDSKNAGSSPLRQ